MWIFGLVMGLIILILILIIFIYNKIYKKLKLKYERLIFENKELDARKKVVQREEIWKQDIK